MPNDTPAPAPSPAPAPAPSPAPAPAAFDWKTGGLDDAGMALVTERQWKDPGALLTSYRNLEKLQGVPPEQIIRLPKDLGAAKPEEMTAIYDRLGRPKDVKDYALPLPEGDKGEFAGVASGWFHEAGLSIKQAQMLAGKWNDHVAAAVKAQGEATAKAHGEQVVALKKEWGAEFDARAAQVDAAARAFGLDEKALLGLKAGMGPAAAMKFLHAVGSKLGVEGDFAAGDRKPGAGGAMTAQQAQARIAELRADKTFAQKFNSSDPTVRSEARAEMKKLHQVAYPDDTVL